MKYQMPNWVWVTITILILVLFIIGSAIFGMKIALDKLQSMLHDPVIMSRLDTPSANEKTTKDENK